MAKSYRKRKSMGKRRRGFGSRRRKNTRKRTNVNVRSNIVPIGLGFPRKIMITHKYVDIASKTVSGALGIYLYKCNGMYDPDYTGTGHQPMYFDQMGALYDHYVVVGSRIRVTFLPYIGATGLGNFRVGIFTADANTIAPTDFNAFAEQSTARWKTLSGFNSYATADQRTLTSRWSAKKFFGKGVLANTDLQGTTSGDPTELSYYCIGVAPLSDISAEQVQFTVEIDYIAVWKEVKSIASS